MDREQLVYQHQLSLTGLSTIQDIYFGSRVRLILTRWSIVLFVPTTEIDQIVLSGKVISIQPSEYRITFQNFSYPTVFLIGKV